MANLTRLPGPNADLWDWQLEAACRGIDSDVFFHPDRERGDVATSADPTLVTAPATSALPLGGCVSECGRRDRDCDHARGHGHARPQPLPASPRPVPRS